jgi:pimeloyl-ACP methyl ester carboxylesterase
VEYETIELTNEVRSTLPGEFIELSDGYVHYELAGPVDGEVVVLVHGFSAGAFVWDNNYEYLVGEGFRVLRYDMYGRGFSDRPYLRYDFELFTRQLYELIQKLGLSQRKVNLVGLSMGGGVCIIFTDQYHELVNKVSLIDPMGFSVGSYSNRILYGLMKTPGFNRLLKRYMHHEFFLESQKDDFPESAVIDGYLNKYREPLRYKGFLRAIHSTASNIEFTSLRDTYERIGKRVPMQLFWGEKDKTMPFHVSKEVLEAVPSIKFHPIMNAGHQPQYSHAQEVNRQLAEFLKQQ